MRDIQLVTSVKIFEDSIVVTIDLAEGLTIHEVWNRLSRAGVRPSEITVGLGVDGELARVVLSEDRGEEDYYHTNDRLAFAIDALRGTVRNANCYA
jgi:hypothetical protein